MNFIFRLTHALNVQDRPTFLYFRFILRDDRMGWVAVRIVWIKSR